MKYQRKRSINMYLLLPAVLLLLGACKSKESADSSSTEEPEPMEESAARVALEPAWETDTVLKTPESVFYDSEYNILYVSCIGNVPPDAKDGDGYLAKVGLNGNVIEARWIEGLNGPKGMGKSGNKLFVADISRVVEVDLQTNQISQTYEVDGATFLNDITVGADGKVYISDSNTSTIYVLQNGEVSVLLQDDNLGGPNGLLVEGNKITTATFGSGKVFTLNTDGSMVESVVDSLPGGDGVVKYMDSYLISNWNGEIYEITADWKKHMLLDTKPMNKNAADIEVIASKNLLLVPTFFGNTVAAYNITKS